jgi:DNA-binding protein HU-beta
VTKKELVDRVAAKSGLTKRDAAAAIDASLDSITEALEAGESVSLTGFGKFSTQRRRARQGVNPRTGERVQIAAATVPKFSAGSPLKDAVRAALPGHPDVPLPDKVRSPVKVQVRSVPG